MSDLKTGAMSRRDGRAVVIGAMVVMVALLVTYGLVPAVSRWRIRETRIERARSASWITAAGGRV